ncbi:TlpA family protein disulfide reductase [Agaribacillus aureus]|uniref:TlpA family protein disulfide reductase n=1 Tax=Agaribacillus aureus TaxID=3051825 RepID=UPI003D1C145B
MPILIRCFQLNDFFLFGESTNIYPDIDKILTIEALKNKVVYVDIWGTRCRSCLREFQYVSKIQQKYHKDTSIVFLYLCSPYTTNWDANNAKRWREQVYQHDLKGMHLLISAECYENEFFNKYKSRIKPENMFMIPTYLLVNKKGEIVNFNAAKPSNQ